MPKFCKILKNKFIHSIIIFWYHYINYQLKYDYIRNLVWSNFYDAIYGASKNSFINNAGNSAFIYWFSLVQSTSWRAHQRTPWPWMICWPSSRSWRRRQRQSCRRIGETKSMLSYFPYFLAFCLPLFLNSSLQHFLPVFYPPSIISRSKWNYEHILATL